jgi:asparagine synthase (glutamine-hydrolysing)
VSGGLDSATLLALVARGSGEGHAAYTFTTGDDRYDEVRWVDRLLAGTPHRSRTVRLDAAAVPELARSVQAHQDEPFGGMPTLAYALLFDQARADGTTVVLDGQGMDEQWAGYDYHGAAGQNPGEAPVVQGTRDPALRPECLHPELRNAAVPPPPPNGFADPLRCLQHRDLVVTKLPRALRYNDRVSMRSSTELREPFLDHRLVELALRQPADRKWRDGTGKWLLRRLAADLLPAGLETTPKRPLQTPQREWLRGPLRRWAEERIDVALAAFGGTWLDGPAVRQEWAAFADGAGDNSFFVWQWVSLGLAVEQRPAAFGARS